jgi:mannose-6-phosphate isomerase-like protein (cupin superfamily)
MFSVLGGDDPGRVLWAPYVFEQAQKHGLVLLQSGRLIDRRRGDTIPLDDPPVRATSTEQVAQLKILDCAGIAACTVRHDDLGQHTGGPFTDLQGVRESAVIGPANPAELMPAAPLSWLHGFHLRALHLEVGASLPWHRRFEEEVLLVHKGTLRVDWADGCFDLGAGDTFTVPIGLLRHFENVGDSLVECYVVRGGDHPAAPVFK